MMAKYLDTTFLVKAYKEAHKRLFLFDYDVRAFFFFFSSSHHRPFIYKKKKKQMITHL